jgi:hypothetical protein
MTTTRVRNVTDVVAFLRGSLPTTRLEKHGKRSLRNEHLYPRCNTGHNPYLKQFLPFFKKRCPGVKSGL